MEKQVIKRIMLLGLEIPIPCHDSFNVNVCLLFVKKLKLSILLLSYREYFHRLDSALLRFR
jgi:hypothetical protein